MTSGTWGQEPAEYDEGEWMTFDQVLSLHQEALIKKEVEAYKQMSPSGVSQKSLAEEYQTKLGNLAEDFYAWEGTTSDEVFELVSKAFELGQEYTTKSYNLEVEIEES